MLLRHSAQGHRKADCLQDPLEIKLGRPVFGLVLLATGCLGFPRVTLRAGEP